MKTKEQIIKEIERLKSELDLMSKSILNMEFKNDTKKLTYNLVYQEMIKMRISICEEIDKLKVKLENSDEENKKYEAFKKFQNKVIRNLVFFKKFLTKI